MVQPAAKPPNPQTPKRLNAGQRIGKVVKPAGSAPADWDYTYYILDAQGNTMSTYNLKGINIYQDRIYTECISVIVQ